MEEHMFRQSKCLPNKYSEIYQYKLSNYTTLARRKMYMGEGQEVTVNMTNEEYRKELGKIFDTVENNQILRYFYIFVSEKLKRMS